MSREQLRTVGIGRGVIDRSVEAGRLRPVFRGAYAIGHVALRREGWWMAALLTCGEGAALSHGSAAHLWGLCAREVLPVEVIVAGDHGRKQQRLIVRRMRLDPSEAMRCDGLRVTTPARTIVDLAATVSGRSLRGAVERAQDLRRFHPDRIEAVLARSPRRPGTQALADLMALLRPDAEGARSHLERLFLALARRARLPRPDVNAVVAGRRRDFAWPEARLVVEVDGYRYHSSRQAKRRDHRRDRELTTSGWRPTRFTYEDVALEPDSVAAELRRLLHGASGP